MMPKYPPNALSAFDFTWEDHAQAAFATPIFSRKYTEQGDFNARLAEVILAREAAVAQDAAAEGGCDGDLTEDRWRDDDVLAWDFGEAQTLEEIFVDAVQTYRSRMGWDHLGSFALSTWANVRRGRSEHFWHDHAQHPLVLNYYVAGPSMMGDPSTTEGSLILRDPRSGASASYTGARDEAYMQWDPTPGLLLAFPGYMLHTVQPTHVEEPRISVSCNVSFGALKLRSKRYD